MEKPTMDRTDPPAAAPPASGQGASAQLHVLPRTGKASMAFRRTLRMRHGHLQILGHDLSTPLILLLAMEFLVLMGAVYVAVHLRFPEPGPPQIRALDALTLKMLIFATVNLVAMLSMGLYRKGACDGIIALLLRLGGALALGASVLVVTFYLLPDLTLGRGVVALAFLLAIVGLLVTRLLGVRLLDLDSFKRKVLVLGAGKNACLLQGFESRHADAGFELVGFVAVANEVPQVESGRLRQPDLPLAQYADLQQVDDVVIALDDARGGFPFDELMACKMNGIDVLDISKFFEREAGILKLDTLRPSNLVFSRGFRQSLYRDFTKRVLDVLTSGALLLLVWPFMLLTALGILIESRGRGTVLYRQVRVGQYGRQFTLLKFRSMTMDAESDGVARWAQEQDPRITRFGHFMRKTRLDELPQLFNVLRGDMSFVGPRPERPVFVKQLIERLPYYDHRHWVKPGVTGWAQINYPYGASEKDAFEKLQYDLYYVKNSSVALDLLTIAQTVEVVLWGRGSR